VKCKYIIRKRQIGDVLWIEPIINEMAKRYKKIYVYTKFNELFENYPLTNVIFKNKLNLLEKFGAFIEKYLGSNFLFINMEMSYEKKPHLHILHAYQEKAALEKKNVYPKLYLSSEEQNETSIHAKNYAIIHLESLTDKNYRKVYGIQWDEICSYFKSKDLAVVLVGKSPYNINGAKFVQTNNLRELISLINKCKIFIGIDSGPSHIAAALKKPALIFFGAVNPEFRHFKEQFTGYFLQQPCEYAGCYHDVISKFGQTCKLVGDNGIPKCSLHSNDYLLKHIQKLLTDISYDSEVY
jgi:ADP-heptose:LPS heptosyltransferase